jgi:hypothetical protein
VDTTARYGLPDRLRVRAGDVGAWVHVVGSLQRIFCRAALLVLALIGAVLLWSARESAMLLLAIAPLLVLAWLGLRDGALLEAVGNDLVSVTRGVGDPHGALEQALAGLCNALLLEATFGAALSVVVATAVVLA